MKFDLIDIVMGIINVYIAIATVVAFAAAMVMLRTSIVSIIRRQYDKDEPAAHFAKRFTG